MLADSSAWIEYLRDADQSVADHLELLLSERRAFITEPVILEVFQGGRSEAHVRRLTSLLARSTLVRVESDDYVEAAFLYRVCRANGVTIRSSLACLIAAVAIRADLPVLHHDRDFDLLALHTPLVASRG